VSALMPRADESRQDETQEDNTMTLPIFKIEDLSQYSGRTPHIVVYRKYKGKFYHVADCDSQDQAERLIRHVEKKKYSPYHEDDACVEFFKFAQKFFKADAAR
tara:strand:+ start:677 stop:985 length:309 start_codon:yes stop_codon:yes gene_type:complete